MKSALAAIALSAALFGCAGCSLQEQPGGQAVEPEPSTNATTGSVTVTWNTESGPWALFISSPRPAGNFQTCLESAAVSSALQSADLPTSHVSATFVESATKDDVAGVVECLEGQLTGGEISVEQAESSN